MKRTLPPSTAFLAFAFLWMALSTGLVGCSRDVETHSPLVEPMLIMNARVYPDSSIYVHSVVGLNYRGVGFFDEGSSGCMNIAPPVDRYEIGSMEDLDSATVEMNGIRLGNTGGWTIGPTYELSVDDEPLGHVGDVYHFDVHVPNQDVAPLDDVTLPPFIVPDLPDDYTVVGLQDTITFVLPLHYDYWAPYSSADMNCLRWVAPEEETSQGYVDHYMFRENSVQPGDTLVVGVEQVFTHLGSLDNFRYQHLRRIIVGN